MDQSSLGGFLGGFVLVGILLPLALSFLAEGAVLYFRGRGPTRLLSAAVVTIAIIGLFSLAWQNAMDTGDAMAMQGSIGLILWFSIPAAILGFVVRMLALYLNPSSKAQDQDAIKKRKARQEERLASHDVLSAHGARHA
jgi:TRAP-type C4-dicarboxylate transport system permease small subunit